MTTRKRIKVTTHVARDFLQNSDYFSTMPKVVWEYVSNALDNPREGEPVEVKVVMTPDRLAIADNASGMDEGALARFFQMHGYNVQRQRGRVVRGRFGTGKCAAFGIAKTLRIETVKNGLYNAVELTRERIEAAKDGSPFAVDELAVNAPTDAGDGTTVIIGRLLNPRRLDVEETRRYVERHLGRHLQGHRVFINGHLCEFLEPVYIKKYEVEPPIDVAERIGPSHLVVKVSPSPLESELNGLDVVSHGLWHDTTTGDLPRQGMVRRVFGEVTCDLLETWEGEPSPFDNTRNNTLNLANPVAATLLGWVSSELRRICGELEAEERDHRRSEEARRFKREAQRLGRLLNEDFSQLRRELARIHRDTGLQLDDGRTEQMQALIGEVAAASDADAALLPGGGDLPTEYQQAGPQRGDGSRGATGAVGDEPKPGAGLLPGDQPGSYRRRDFQPRTAETFAVEFVHDTWERPRSHYDRDTRTIRVNLDHPQLVAARGVNNDTESEGFRQIAYEIAFVEYALALMTEEAHRDPAINPHDLLYDLRRTVNRIAARVPELL